MSKRRVIGDEAKGKRVRILWARKGLHLLFSKVPMEGFKPVRQNFYGFLEGVRKEHLGRYSNNQVVLTVRIVVEVVKSEFWMCFERRANMTC